MNESPGPDARAMQELDTATYIFKDFAKQVETHVGDNYMMRSIMQMRLNDVNLYDDIWMPSFQTTTKNTFYSIESIEHQ